ncbi:MAG: phage/plasmid replication protein [Balneolaceae bacterium]
MIDTVRIYFPQDLIHEVDLISEVPTILCDVTSHSNNDRVWYSGKLKNLSWSVRKDGISISGSLTKYICGNNYTNMNQETLNNAIDQLSSYFGVDLTIGRITQLDFGINLNCKEAPMNYFKCLGSSPYYKSRSVNNSTLSYSNRSRTKLFYDKLKQMKATNVFIPEKFIGLNILRFEVRYRKKAFKYFGRKELRVKDLLTSSFHKRLKEQLFKEFSSIQTVLLPSISKEIITTASIFGDQLIALAIEQLGMDVIYDLVDSCTNMDSQNKTRSRQRCMKVLKKFHHNNDESLYDELTINFIKELKKI